MGSEYDIPDCLTHLSGPSFRRRAYSLPELVVAMSLATILGAILLGGVVFLSHSKAALRSHDELQSMTELALLQVEQDVQNGKRVVTVDPAEWTLKLAGPDADNDDFEVVYLFDYEAGHLIRAVPSRGERRILLSNVREGKFHFWGRGQAREVNEPEAVLRVSFEATLEKRAGRRSVVEKTVSASFLLRNIELGEVVFRDR